MTAKPELLPLPEHFAHQSERVQEHVRAYARANVAHATAAKDAEIDALRTRLEDTVRDSTNEIERLRADKLDLEAALEHLKSHKEIAAMNQIGVIKALTEIRDEQGAEIHRLRAELEIEKGQAEFYRNTRNWSQQKAERLEEALQECIALGHPRDPAIIAARAALRDHDQEGKDG